MSGFFKYSIGKKFLMSVSGLFLVMFLLIHLLINSFLLIPDGGRMFNAAAHFMATNPVVKIIEPILAIGFILHIIWGLMITLQNHKARGKIRYLSGHKTKNISLPSKNMFVLGLAVLSFIFLHLSHFWFKMKFVGNEMIAIEISGVSVQVENIYALVSAKFSVLWIVIIYVIASLCISLHISHGVWSAFQSVGICNTVWQKRLKTVSILFAFIVGIGFSTIAIYCCVIFKMTHLLMFN